MSRFLSTIVLSAIASVTLLGQSDASDRFRRPSAPSASSDARIATYEKQLKEAPDDPKVQAALASAFLQKLRETTDFAYLNRAAALVDRLLSADPKNYDGIRLRVEIETHRHNFPHAAELAQQLIERNPSDTGALGLLGDSLMESGQYDAAGDAYRRMLELSPNLTSYNRIAYHRWVTGKSDEALSWMATAVQAGSAVPENLAWCLVEFGDLLFKTGHSKDAQLAYAQALETLPGYHRAYGAMGRRFAALGDFKNAIANFEKAQAVIPLPDYAGPLAILYAKVGRTADAAHQMELLDVIDKLGVANGEKGNRALALIYADQKVHLDRAVELSQAELATRRDVYTYDALSWALFRDGKQKEAEAASRKATEQQTPEPLFLYHAGIIALGGREREAGLKLLQRALAINPEFSYPQAGEAKRLVETATAPLESTSNPAVLR